MAGTDNNHIRIDFDDFVEVHRPQLNSSAIPELYWKTLHKKIQEETYDAGDKFQMIQELGDADDSGKRSWKVQVFCEEGVKKDDPDNIFLIDHAWTYRANEARQYLEEVAGLLERMEALFELELEHKSQGYHCTHRIDRVLDEMWKYNQTYKFGHFHKGSQEAQPVWYIMDEFGSRIQHSDDPSFRVVPFMYSPTRMGYSLMWPVKDLQHGEEVTRDYVEQASDPLVREAKLLPWIPKDFQHVSFKQTEPDVAYFKEYQHEETLPPPDFESEGLPKDRKIRVFMDYETMAKHLTDERFELVDTAEEADILWTHISFKDFKGMCEQHPRMMINQFPCENVVCVKDLLAIVSRRAAALQDEDPDSLEPGPLWLPVTYNLQTELPKFVSYFQHREDKGLDNHWICKPWNLARGLDMHITSNLNYIVRLPESGPKVACKYVENPVLFDREDVGKVKFDIRYIVLLSSVQPLKLFAYNVFWLRFANKPYSLDFFDEYEKHFTVMNYAEGVKLKQLHYDEFIPLFEKQYPDFPWTRIEKDIFTMLRQIFEAAITKPPPQGIGHSPQSRAIYAVDFLLGWQTDHKTGERYMQPKLCEVNYSPDCDRACKYHPHFVNDVFSTLFLEDTEGKHVTAL